VQYRKGARKKEQGMLKKCFDASKFDVLMLN
jgi:hypothetical protein